MKALISFFILSSCLLFAQASYVYVSSPSTPQELQNIQYKLIELGYGTHSNVQDGRTNVYAGPFKSKEEANNALVAITQSLSSTYISTKKVVRVKSSTPQQQTSQTAPTHTPAQQVYTQPKPPAVYVLPSTAQQNTPKNIPNTQDYAEFFLGVSLGGAIAGIEEKDVSGSITLANEPDTDGLSLEIEGGYYFYDQAYVSLQYQRVSLADVNIDNIITNLNYKFNEKGTIHPYVGLMLGFSRLQWSEEPITSNSSDLASFSFIGGAQIGLETAILDGFSFLVQYRYALMEHVTTINVSADTKKITHADQDTLSIGLRYNF